MSRNEEVHWRKRPVTVEFEHLNPALQGIIGRESGLSSTLGGHNNIKSRRFMRATSEATGLNLLLGLVGLSALPHKVLSSTEGRNMMGLTSGGLILASSLRLLLAKTIQRKHKQLIKSMKRFGILQPCFEGNYPGDWINPAIVANSHPVFYVNAKGDMVFLRSNRWEYARYVFQKSFAGKIGLNLWRWRGYLEPPKAPQPVREWAKEKALEWAGALKRVPKRRPAFE